MTITKILVLPILLLTGSAISIAQTASGTKEEFGTVTGEVMVRARMAIPAHAVLNVWIEDVSKMDVAAEVISKNSMALRGRQSPLSFVVPYRKKDIIANHRYALRGEIEVDGTRWFTSTAMVPVLTDGGKSKVVLNLDPMTYALPLEDTDWTLTELQGVPAGKYGKATTMKLDIKSKRVSGSGGVNSYSGTLEHSTGRIKFGPLMSTKMAGSPEAMQQEQTFFQMMAKVDMFRQNGSQLVLLSNSRVLMVFSGKPARATNK